MSNLGPLTHLLRRVQRRLRCQRVLDALAVCSALSLSLLAVAVFAGRFDRHWLEWALPCALALPVLGGALAALRRIPLLRAAYAVDHNHALDDRSQSALQFAAEGAPTPFMQAAMRDAARRSTDLSPQRAAPLHAPRAVRYNLVALAALALAQVVPLPASNAGDSASHALSAVSRVPLLDAETAAAFDSELNRLRSGANSTAALDEWLREYERILQQMREGVLSRAQALQQLDALQRSLEAARAGHEAALDEALDTLATRLSGAAPSKQVGDAVARRQLEGAADALDTLARKVRDKQLSARDREALRKALDEASRAANADHAPEEQSLLKKKKPAQRPREAEEPSLLKKEKKERKRQLDRLRKQQQAKEQTRRKLEQLRRELGEASRDLTGQGSERLQRGAQRMRDLAQQGLDAEQQRKLAEQLDQLREQLQRERQERQAGAGGGQQRQQGQGEGQPQPQAQGQSQRMKRFSLRAQGDQAGDAGGTPLALPGARKPRQPQEPGPDGGSPPPQAGNEPGTPPGDRGAGSVLELGGDGPANAQIEVPGLVEETANTPGGQGDEPGDASEGDPNRRLSGKLQDSQLSGAASKGPSRSEVIFGAAQQGFATTPYSKVYTDYRSHAESVLERDEIPPGYRFYVRRYFQLIRPREGEPAQ